MFRHAHFQHLLEHFHEGYLIKCSNVLYSKKGEKILKHNNLRVLKHNVISELSDNVQ